MFSPKASPPIEENFTQLTKNKEIILRKKRITFEISDSRLPSLVNNLLFSFQPFQDSGLLEQHR